MRRGRRATLGRQPTACGDEQDPQVCGKCLVIGAYRRPLCPPMPQWTDRQPVNRPLVDLRSHLLLLSISRTVLTALSAHVTDASAPETARFFVWSSTSPDLMHSSLGWSLSFILEHPGGGGGQGGGLACASNFATFVSPGSVAVSLI